MKQVDRGQPVEELRVGEVAGVEVVGAPDPGQQLRQRVDRHRVPGLASRASRPASRASSCRCRRRPSARGRVRSAIARVEVVDELANARRRPPATLGSRSISEIGGRSKLTPSYLRGSVARTPRVRACWIRRAAALARRGRRPRRRRSSRCRRRPRAGTPAAASRPGRVTPSATSISGGLVALGRRRGRHRPRSCVARGRRTRRTSPGTRAARCRSGRCGSCARSARRSPAAPPSRPGRPRRRRSSGSSPRDR